MDVAEHFPKIDFNSIKLNISTASPLLQTSSEYVNIEDDATTQLSHNDFSSRRKSPPVVYEGILKFLFTLL